jgi:hypothetical protein
MKSDIHKRLKIHILLSVLIAVTGILLLVFMITEESEPGGIPLLLTVSGAGWFFIEQRRLKSQQTL